MINSLTDQIKLLQPTHKLTRLNEVQSMKGIQLNCAKINEESESEGGCESADVSDSDEDDDGNLSPDNDKSFPNQRDKMKEINIQGNKSYMFINKNKIIK